MYQLFIGGNYVDGKGKKIDVINPADNTLVDSFCSATKNRQKRHWKPHRKHLKPGVKLT